MTPEEYAHGIIAKANAGYFNPEGSGLYKEIVKSISAAVAAERERCAKAAGGIWHLKSFEGDDIDHVITDPIADAIRALK